MIVENMRAWADYRPFLEALVRGGDIQNVVAEGITRKVLETGFGSLTDKQRAVFETHVRQKFPQPKCGNCGMVVQWDEGYDVMHGDDCSDCAESWVSFNGD